MKTLSINQFAGIAGTLLRHGWSLLPDAPVTHALRGYLGSRFSGGIEEVTSG
jgi:hypothetical protein